VLHNLAWSSSDNIPSLPPDNHHNIPSLPPDNHHNSDVV